jgi:hypothetical protein
MDSVRDFTLPPQNHLPFLKQTAHVDGRLFIVGFFSISELTEWHETLERPLGTLNTMYHRECGFCTEITEVVN